MSFQDLSIKLCCESEPTWIFVYENDTIFGICDEDFTSQSYRLKVKRVIKINTRQEFAPEKIFGEK